MEYRKVTLPNGLRILVGEMPETRSVSLFVYVGVGSRIETKDDAGTSHFLEHMVFKGSAKRPTAADISQVIESRSEEHTSELQSHSDLVCRLLLEKKNAILQVMVRGRVQGVGYRDRVDEQA